jgi:hypothetical protein
MTDFFTRTVERALGIAPVVRPDLPSLLAPSARAEGAQPGNFAADDRANVSPSSDRLAQPRRPPRGGTRQERSQERTEGEDEAPKLFLQNDIDGNSRERRSPAVVTQSEFQTTAHSDGIVFLDRQTDLSRAASQASVAASERSVARPVQAATAAGEIPAVKHPSAAPPAIHVSIGRVEVRAISAPPARTTAGERKTARGLTLEQYLRERNEGRR